MTSSDQQSVVDTGHPRKWQILAIMCTCLILVVAGVSSLNLAIPSIIDALQPTQTETLWIVDAYALVFAGLLLPAGAIGDRYGRKRTLLFGLAVFALAAIWASTSSDPTSLITARATMGAGAAFIMPSTLSILTSVFPPHERAKAIAVWAGFAGAGGAIGIIGGGVLLEFFWWGSVFFINVPIAVVAGVLVATMVPESRDEQRRPLDPVGALLSIAGLVSLVYAIIEGGEVGWTNGSTIAWFVAAAVFLAGFVRYELSVEHPMLDPRWFKIRPFAIGSLTLTAAFAVMFGMFFLIVQFFQFVQGHSPLEAALRNLPFPITMVLIAPRSPALTQRVGARGTITIGLAIQAFGFVLLSSTQPDTAYIWIAIGLVLLAGGMAMLMPAATASILGSLPQSKAGVGSAVNDTTREVGGALGIAVMGTLLATGYRSSLGDATDSLPAEAAELAEDSIGGAFQVASRLPGAEAAALVEEASLAFTDGMQLAYLTAAGVGVVTAVIVAIFYPRKGKERQFVDDTESTPAG